MQIRRKIRNTTSSFFTLFLIKSTACTRRNARNALLKYPFIFFLFCQERHSRCVRRTCFGKPITIDFITYFSRRKSGMYVVLYTEVNVKLEILLTWRVQENKLSCGIPWETLHNRWAKFLVQNFTTRWLSHQLILCVFPTLPLFPI